MKFQLDIDIKPLPIKIRHHQRIMLVGSCFTEHMSRFLSRHKFQTMQNSHGILFNPWSVCKALEDVVNCKMYTANDLFFLNEYWHSWLHHSDFSSMDVEISLQGINQSIQEHHDFLKTTDYLLLTLGSSFVYRNLNIGSFVSNNHRAPANDFEKILLSIQDMTDTLTQIQLKINEFNPRVQFIYTLSPVRHIRDGVIENNRSKARLLEVIHALPNSYYFPAYELVMDVLRDYRFYDIDMVHPNYQATAYVWEKFTEACIDPASFSLMETLNQLYKAKNHRPKGEDSKAHQIFKERYLQLCIKLLHDYPYLNLEEEIAIFSN